MARGIWAITIKVEECTEAEANDLMAEMEDIAAKKGFPIHDQTCEED